MWIAAFFGMATKYAEGLLAIKYRTKDANGEVSGGPMYLYHKRYGEKMETLSYLLCIGRYLSGIFRNWYLFLRSIHYCFPKNSFNWSPQIVSILIAIVVAVIIFGGIQSIAKVSEKLVPFMAAAYIIATLIVIL